MGTSNKKTIFFCPYVDNFGVNYFSKDDADHILNSLGNHHALSTGWEGCNYIGMNIKRNYKEVYVNILIPEYVSKSLEHLQHPNLKRPQYASHQQKVPTYVRQPQMEPYID